MRYIAGNILTVAGLIVLGGCSLPEKPTEPSIEGPALAAQPRELTASVGSDFDISIIVDSVENLMGTHIVIAFDKEKLEAVGGREGSFLGKNGGRTAFFCRTNNEEGTIDISLLVGESEPPGVSGSGTLAVVVFHANTAGTTRLDFDDSCEFRDHNNSVIQIVEKVGGMIEIE